MFLRSSSAYEQRINSRDLQLQAPSAGVCPTERLPEGGACYLVSHLFDFALIFVGPLQSLSSSLLLSIQLTFQLPHLREVKTIPQK